PAPATGTSAAVPGNAVWGPKAANDHATAPRPAQPIAASAHPGSRRPKGAASARRPPTASSHALVGSEKKAHGSSVEVRCTHSQKEGTATTVSAPTTVQRDRSRAGNRFAR